MTATAVAEFAHSVVFSEILYPHWDQLDLPQSLHDLSEQQLLDLLDRATQEDIQINRAPNTSRAYAQDWQVWQRFCDDLGVASTTVHSGLFYSYVKYLEGLSSAPATIERRLAGVLAVLRERHGANIPSEHGPTRKARKRIEQFRIELERTRTVLGRGPAVVVTFDQIWLMCGHISRTLYGIRDKAILLVGLAIASRRSELANLDVEDVVLDPKGRGMTVTVRASKGGGTRVVQVYYSADELVCPVRAWLAWLDASGITTGPAFRGMRGAQRPVLQNRRITPARIGDIIKALGKLISLSLDLTGHSLRAGRITIAFDGGHSVEQVAKISGHSPNSNVIQRYYRPVDAWRNPALRMPE